jgi:integrase
MEAEKARSLGYTPPSEKSFADVAAQFLIHQRPRESAHNYTREVGIVELHLKPFFTGELRAVTKAQVQRYVTERCGEASPGTVLKEVTLLKHLLRLAVEEWQYIPINPARGVRPPKVSKGRIRYLQPGDLRAVLESCPGWLRIIVAIAVTTGMRRSEILKLRRLDVDLEHSRVMLPQTKNGEGRIVYLNQMASVAIRSTFGTQTKPTDLLFPDLNGPKVTMAFAAVCRRLGIADFHFHDLRHTAASWLRMRGADIHTVAQLLGHKDLKMAARYQHLSPDFLADAVGRLDEVFGHQAVTAPKALPAAVAASA